MYLSRFVLTGLLFFTILASPLAADTAAVRSHHRLLLVGDTSFGEQYQARYARQGGQNILSSKGYDHSLEKLAPLMQSADLVVANLETSLNSLQGSPFQDKKQYIHQGLPNSVAKTLAGHRVKAVSLANNHAFDFGAQGLQQTLTTLEKYGIRSFGSGLTAEQAAKPLNINLGSGDRRQKVLIVSGMEYRANYAMEYNYYAGAETPGVNLWSDETASTQLSVLRQREPEAFIIAFPHWGRNYAWKNVAQTELAHALIDAGADLVIGHGAHLFQELEAYRGRWIIYNLGNFMFNSRGRYLSTRGHPFGLAAMLNVDISTEQTEYALRLYPLFSDNLSTNYQPQPVTEQQFKRAVTLLARQSSKPKQLVEQLQLGKDRSGRFLALRVDPPRAE